MALKDVSFLALPSLCMILYFVPERVVSGIERLKISFNFCREF